MLRLPFLGVKIPDAKALRYFRICDTDGSGEIDIDEFRVALFICDPVFQHKSSHLMLGCLLNLLLLLFRRLETLLDFLLSRI